MFTVAEDVAVAEKAGHWEYKPAAVGAKVGVLPPFMATVPEQVPDEKKQPINRKNIQ